MKQKKDSEKIAKTSAGLDRNNEDIIKIISGLCCTGYFNQLNCFEIYWNKTPCYHQDTFRGPTLKNTFLGKNAVLFAFYFIYTSFPQF